MHTSNSIIKSIIEKVRIQMDEGEVQGKFTDSFIASYLIPEATSQIMQSLNMDRDDPVVAGYDVSVVSGQSTYVIPFRMNGVVAVVREDTNGELIEEAIPQGYFSPRGSGWRIEPGRLVIEPVPRTTATWTVKYQPGTWFLSHYATDGTLASGLASLTLSASPATGRVDDEEGSYVGAQVRVLTGGVETRVVTGHTVSGGTHTVTFDRAFTKATAGTVTYEIVPPVTFNLMNAIAYRVMLTIAEVRDASAKRQDMLRRHFYTALKGEVDRIANLNKRTGKVWRVDDRSRHVNRMDIPYKDW